MFYLITDFLGLVTGKGQTWWVGEDDGALFVLCARHVGGGRCRLGMFWRASCRTFTPGIDLSHKGWIFLRFPCSFLYKDFFIAVQKEMTRGMAKLSGVVPGPWSQGKWEHFGLRHVASNVPWWIEVAGASAACACQGSGIQGREMVDLFCVFFPDSADALFGSWNLHRWDASMLLMSEVSSWNVVMGFSRVQNWGSTMKKSPWRES